MQQRADCSVATKEREIPLDYPAVQIQKGGSDCGVIFATSLCTVDSPATITYHQPSLHRYLMECLERQTITPYSDIKNSKKSTRVRYSECFRVYFCCCQPENDERIVERTGCHKWYHDMCCPFQKLHSLTEQLSGFVLVVG